jgi:hypothetical protein
MVADRPPFGTPKNGGYENRLLTREGEAPAEPEARGQAAQKELRPPIDGYETALLLLKTSLSICGRRLRRRFRAK